VRLPILLVAAVALASGCRSAPPPARRPSLLLVTIDTLRADHSSAYGYARDTTPVLSRLAREGALVEQAYAPTATTAPSHASLLTSLYPLSHGVLRNMRPLAASHVTLAERLQAAGYATGAVVSSLVLTRRWGFAQGFSFFHDELRGRDAGGGHTPGTPARDRRADATTDIALEWLAERDRRAPFFLWVHYFDPHAPYAPPAPFDTMFEPAEGGALAKQVAAYDGEVAFVDHELGRLLGAVDPERTLVVATSDHGEGLEQHGIMGHELHLYEEAVRVPLVWRFPAKVRPSTRLAGPVEHVDIVPTILDLLGLPAEAPALQGRSLAGALAGKPSRASHGRMVFLQRASRTRWGDEIVARGAKFGVRFGRWKYIEAEEEGTRELYDLERDPGETVNLAGREPAEAARLARAIAAFRARYDRGASPAEEPEADVREDLKALGYTQ
jgi:choline-sulfatase